MHASSLEAYNCSADSYVHSVVILLSIYQHCFLGCSPAAEAASAAVTFALPGVLGFAPPCSSTSSVADLPEPAAHMTGDPASHAALASPPCSSSSFTTATLPAFIRTGVPALFSRYLLGVYESQPHCYTTELSVSAAY